MFSMQHIIYYVLVLTTRLPGGICRDFTVTSQYRLDIKHGLEELGYIIIGIFGEDAPKSEKNFRQLCTKGINGKSYAGSRFHRVIERFVIQGGDVVSGDGKGTISIYGKYFDDEDLAIEHSVPGMVGWASSEPNGNGCQFYITTAPGGSKYLNGKHTIFGKVVDGTDIVSRIEKVRTDSNDQPVKDIFITKCLEESLAGTFTVDNDFYGAFTLRNWLRVVLPYFLISVLIFVVTQYFVRKFDCV